MKNTKIYLDEAKKKLGIESDYALSKHLGITKQTMSGYQSGYRVMDDYTAAKVAGALEINPLEVIAAANAEREKDDKKREFWQKLARTSVAAIVTIPLLFSGLESEQLPVENQHFIHYARSVIWFLLVMLGVLVWWLWSHDHGQVKTD